MQRIDLIVKMGPVCSGVTPDSLNLPFEPLEPARLVIHAIPEGPHHLSESIHFGGQVVESHVKVVSQVGGVTIVHPLGCGFGSIGGPGNMDAHAL